MYSADEARHFAQKYPGKMPTRMATGSARINSWCTPCSRVAQRMHPASLAGAVGGRSRAPKKGCLRAFRTTFILPRVTPQLGRKRGSPEPHKIEQPQVILL